MSEGLFTVSREFVNRVEERVGMGADSREFVRPERICEAVIAEREATRAAPSAAPGKAVSDEQCADHLDRLAELRVDSIGGDVWYEAFARGARALRAAPAPVRVSEAIPEDERCEDCGTRRATVHVESASVNELCEGCYIVRLERQVSLPHAVARRLLGRFIQNLGYKCRLDADGYCQAHFLEKPCVVAEAREVLAALAAQEGSRGCQCGHTNAEHVAVYSGGVNTLDCTKCDCTVYPRNFPTEEAPRG